ncbi:hypothetical protein HYR99_08955 [Candidatus Poribacteria bacterium]|nr:hypothetical protein [Candidatus Poribacteria bacterium]
MKQRYMLFPILAILLDWSHQSEAGIWQDDFENPASLADWHGDLANFWIQDGQLGGRSAHPIALVPPRFIYIGEDWSDYTIQCKVNVHTPNLLECSKGALLLRYKQSDGYIFALHAATQRVEVYRPSGEVLLSVSRKIELEQWYVLRAELQGDEMAFYVNGEWIGRLKDQRSPRGAVGLLVEDALLVLFDDFWVTGAGIPNGGHGMAAVEAKGKLATTWGRRKSGIR